MNDIVIDWRTIVGTEQLASRDMDKDMLFKKLVADKRYEKISERNYRDNNGGKDIALKNLYLDLKIEDRTEYARSVIPELYVCENLSRIPHGVIFNKTQTLDKGIYLYGDSATFKTRMISIRLLKEIWNWKKISFISQCDFAIRASKFLYEGNASLDWINSVCSKSDIVYLDDMFRTGLNDSQENLLLYLVEKATTNNTRIYITSGISPTNAISFFRNGKKSMVAQSVFRRIKEFCDILLATKKE